MTTCSYEFRRGHECPHNTTRECTTCFRDAIRSVLGEDDEMTAWVNVRPRAPELAAEAADSLSYYIMVDPPKRSLAEVR